MNKSININVALGADRMPEQLTWNASDITVEKDRVANAVLLFLWDRAEQRSLSFELWTKMREDEMAAFFMETFMNMADVYERSGGGQELADDIRKFTMLFKNKVEKQLIERNAPK